MANSESGPTLTLRPRRKRDFLYQSSDPVLLSKPKKKKKTTGLSLSLREILKRLMASPTGVPFNTPPNPADFPGYADQVDHIDLTTVLSNLNDGLYRDSDARFISDVRRVWTTAIDYFPATSTRHQLAEANQKDFESYLDRLEKQKNPLKMMEERVAVLERKMADVLSRLDRNEQRKARPPTGPELQRLSTELLALPDEFRRGMIALAPNHFRLTGAGECQVDLEGLPRNVFEELKKYIRRNRNKKPKKPTVVEQTPPTADEDFIKGVKRGQAELMQARGGKEDSSSDDSSSDSSSDDEVGLDISQANI